MFSRVDRALPNYSRTYRKQPPKMQRLSGRLREVVVYKKQSNKANIARDLRMRQVVAYRRLETMQYH